MIHMLNMLPSLKSILLIDALASSSTGFLLAFGGNWLAALLGLPVQMLVPTGVFLMAYGLFVAVVGTRQTIQRGLVQMIIVANFAWAAASVTVLAGSILSPSSFGMAFTITQALVVAIIAEIQFFRLPVDG